jgi:hypothetical protein
MPNAAFAEIATVGMFDDRIDEGRAAQFFGKPPALRLG